MTREEEIKKAIDIQFPKGLGERTNEQALASAGFELGVHWADNHPINIWHDVSEEPQKFGEWFIAQIGNDAFDTFVMAMEKNQDWKNWSNGINIKRWAYIEELLPKGCK